MRRMPNPFALFRGENQFTAHLADELDRELSIPPMSLLERQHAEVSQTLDALRGDKIRIEEEIADRSEQLRQTEVAIRSFEAAEEILERGKTPLSVEAHVERLVPRRAGKS